ncbi:MAG: hypothetical protein OXC05_11505, partial [Halieaceae bacterium]|nr:hypothetical protein [Halieaceae bacterium]
PTARTHARHAAAGAALKSDPAHPLQRFQRTRKSRTTPLPKSWFSLEPPYRPACPSAAARRLR